jgi:hypothetical protein
MQSRPGGYAVETRSDAPIARIRRGAKNAGETRRRGRLRLVAELGGRPPVEGVRRLGYALPARDPRLASLSPRLTPEREAGVRGNWICLRPNADAPTSLSSLLLLGLQRIGESTDEVDLPGAAWGVIFREMAPRHPLRQNVRPGAKRRRPGYPQ